MYIATTVLGYSAERLCLQWLDSHDVHQLALDKLLRMRSVQLYLADIFNFHVPSYRRT